MLLAVDHVKVSMSITSTVANKFNQSPCLPATTRAFPLHTTAVCSRLVGMCGKCSTHFFLPPSFRLRSVLSTKRFLPPTAVIRPLMTVRVKSSLEGWTTPLCLSCMNVLEWNHVDWSKPCYHRQWLNLSSFRTVLPNTYSNWMLVSLFVQMFILFL